MHVTIYAFFLCGCINYLYKQFAWGSATLIINLLSHEVEGGTRRGSASNAYYLPAGIKFNLIFEKATV